MDTTSTPLSYYSDMKIIIIALPGGISMKEIKTRNTATQKWLLAHPTRFIFQPECQFNGGGRGRFPRSAAHYYLGIRQSQLLVFAPRLSILALCFKKISIHIHIPLTSTVEAKSLCRTPLNFPADTKMKCGRVCLPYFHLVFH